MNTYLGILRGINVGGKNRLKMSDLKALCEKLGFESVETYVQSGNLVFKSMETETDQIAERLERGLYNEWGLEVPVLVFSKADWGKVIEENPFLRDPNKNPDWFHVTFLAKPSPVEGEQNWGSHIGEGEAIEVFSKAVYLYCPNGYAKTKLHNGYLEKALKVKATTRNWKTTLQLYKLATSI